MKSLINNFQLFSYKMIAEYSGSSEKEQSFYINAIFNGQSSKTKRWNANENVFWFVMKTKPRHQSRKSFYEYQCNERYPCPKEVWHITEVLWKILALPTSLVLMK